MKIKWQWQYFGFNLVVLATIILSLIEGKKPFEDFWLRLFMLLLLGNGTVFLWSKNRIIRKRLNLK